MEYFLLASQLMNVQVVVLSFLLLCELVKFGDLFYTEGRGEPRRTPEFV